jgi:hypothetical protein
MGEPATIFSRKSARRLAERTVDTHLLRRGTTAGGDGWRSPRGQRNRDSPRNVDPPVWNIRTDASLIGDHNDIMQPRFLEFVRQLYDDTTVTTPCGSGRQPVSEAASLR